MWCKQTFEVVAKPIQDAKMCTHTCVLCNLYARIIPQVLEERKQEILNPSEHHGANLNLASTSHETDPRLDATSRSETDNDKAQDTATPTQRLNGTEYHAAHQTQYETNLQSAHPKYL